MISSDRPKEYRKSGAPQAIEQKDLFKPYTLKNYDLEFPEKFFLPDSFSYPVHINVCVERPDLKEEWKKSLSLETQERSSDGESDFLTKGPCPEFFSRPSQTHKVFKKLNKPLVLLGSIPKFYQEPLEDFLLSLKTFIYAEPHSGLRESKKLKPYLITSSEKFLHKLPFQSILRFGSVPFLNFWREIKKDTPVLNVSDRVFSGLSFIKESAMSFEMFFEKREELLGETSWSEEHKQKDQLMEKQKQKILDDHPLSEQALMRELSTFIKEGGNVFLGNSLPIRYWSTFSIRDRQCHVFSNRGANGIDGLLSTSLGLLSHRKSTWSFLGDLSTLYDLSGLWAKKFFKDSFFNW